MPPSYSTGSDSRTPSRIREADYLCLDRIVDLQHLQAVDSVRYPCLLQTVSHDAGDGGHGRYDILFAFTEHTIDCHPDAVQDFFDQLDQLPRGEPIPDLPEQLPFVGGWFVYLSYEMAGIVETGLNLPQGAADRSMARACRAGAALINDHRKGCCYLLATGQAPRRLGAIVADLERSVSLSAPVLGPLHEAPAADYLSQVRRIRDYIRDGDVFQVNLSRQWSLDIDSGGGAQAAHWLYRSLCRHNPAPFAAHLCLDDYHIISSSPERLLRRRGDWLETRPIAGTRPRDSRRDQDLALSMELLAHPKERAEHIMLIDLERNDLGRVCIPGTISVDELMVLESYAHVHHIVSNVRGRARPALGAGSALRAVFPGGTITGCPKVRCMEIIAELERSPRGAYTGSVGYISDNGNLDFNILIRTLELHRDRLWFRTGAGIVSDSDPGRELAETRAKALGLLRSLGVDR